MSEGAHLWCEQRQERPWTGRGRAASRESPARSRSPPSAIMKWTPAKNRKSYILYNNLQIPYIKRNKEMAMKNTTFFMFQVSSLLYGMCNNKLRMPKIKRLKWRKIIRRSLALKTELKQKSLFVFRKKINIFPICEYFSVIFHWQCCFHLKFSCKKMCRCYNIQLFKQQRQMINSPTLRIRIQRVRMFLGLLDPDPLVRNTDPDPSIIKKLRFLRFRFRFHNTG
jgi:hypothetical protein